ncbi:MAG TPA: hypothetical protein DCZ76_00700 [Treponema sp.]|nr:hypothetical protein [Treponema sp.]
MPQGNGGGSRNPGKRGKMPSVAFYPVSFLGKTNLLCRLRNDAPSLALWLCGLGVKCYGGLPEHGVAGTVKRWHLLQNKNHYRIALLNQVRFLTKMILC